eukprot:gene5274-5657_t
MKKTNKARSITCKIGVKSGNGIISQEEGKTKKNSANTRTNSQASPEKSRFPKHCDVDKVFSFTSPQIQSHQSYAVDDASGSKACQSLSEQVFALPLELFLQYLPQPSLQSIITTQSTVHHKRLRSPMTSLQHTSIVDFAKFRRMEIERHLLFIHDLFPKTNSMWYDVLVSFPDITKHLILLFEKVYKLFQAHYSRLSKISNLSRVGKICAYSGGLLHHFDQLGLLLLSFDQGIHRHDLSSVPIRGVFQFQHYYRSILIAIRAMEHVERICLSNCTTRVEQNPCLRYFIETIILSPKVGYTAFTWSEDLPVCLYSLTPEAIAYLVVVNPNDPSARLLHEKKCFDVLVEDTCSLHQLYGVYNYLLPLLFRDEHFISWFPTEEVGRSIEYPIISTIAPLILLLFNKAKAVAMEILKLFDVEELNFFWKRMFTTVKDVNIVIIRFQRWFEMMISYAAHCIIDIEEDKKRRKALLMKTKTGVKIGYGVGSAGPVNLYSKLLRLTLVMIGKLKMEFPELRDRLYSDKVLKYEITKEDEEKMSDFVNMKAYLMT